MHFTIRVADVIRIRPFTDPKLAEVNLNYDELLLIVYQSIDTNSLLKPTNLEQASDFSSYVIKRNSVKMKQNMV